VLSDKNNENDKMVPFSGMDALPTILGNDVVERMREDELSLQFTILDSLWATSIEERLAKRDLPSFIIIPQKKSVRGKDPVFIDVKITAKEIAARWSVKTKDKKDQGFFQNTPSVKKRLDDFRFHPHTDTLKRDFSDFLQHRDTKGRKEKYSLIMSSTDIHQEWFDSVCELRAMEAQAKHFFRNSQKAFLPDTIGYFFFLRTVWTVPQKQIKAKHRAFNVLGIGAEARKRELDLIGQVDTKKLIEQINEDKTIVPEQRIALMERLLKFEQGKAEMAARYAEVASKDIAIIKELEVPVMQEFKETMREGRELLRESLARKEKLRQKRESIQQRITLALQDISDAMKDNEAFSEEEEEVLYEE
jgi:hypothetical protein